MTDAGEVRAAARPVPDVPRTAFAGGSALGVSAVPLGVDESGRSGSVRDVYELHDLRPGAIGNAALAALQPANR
ncbi:hypothetical protein [Spirillospora sp. NPDC048819]|uniref:hypothetical protein n=1 Tax=Spirillospora sp. NPDC048819 TaxID=3155268 RepID=UPI00340CDB80